MGKKISVDSATLMNKALEIIEAFYLFRVRPEQIEVVVHPQSIVHSLVEFLDGSAIAQLSMPDMKIPILYSLTYPQRCPSGVQPLDFSVLKKLEFLPVDPEKFLSIRMAYDVLAKGMNAGAVFNTANEVAVEYFLKEQIKFQDIFEVVAAVLDSERFYPLNSLTDVRETIVQTRARTIAYIEREVCRC